VTDVIDRDETEEIIHDPTTTELAWRIGGPQGSGVDTAAGLFARVCAHAGTPRDPKEDNKCYQRKP
jgi:hypothetical protein